MVGLKKKSTIQYKNQPYSAKINHIVQASIVGLRMVDVKKKKTNQTKETGRGVARRKRRKRRRRRPRRTWEK